MLTRDESESWRRGAVVLLLTLVSSANTVTALTLPFQAIRLEVRRGARYPPLEAKSPVD